MADTDNKEQSEQRTDQQDTQGTLAAAVAAAVPTTLTTTTTSIPPPKPPASSPGADDPTAGISAGSGGLSSTAAIGSPVRDEPATIIGSLRGLLGLGPKEKDAADTDPSKAGTPAGLAATPAGAALVIGTTVELPDRTKPSPSSLDPTFQPSTAAHSSDAATPAGTNAHTDTSADQAPTTSASSSSTTTTTAAAAASNPSSPPTNTIPSDSTESSDNTQQSSSDNTESSDHKPPKSGGKMENRDAIPTAGGERLGEKHWGESKIVPDNPKSSDGEGQGVSSKSGQPTDEVAANTAKNTGSAGQGDGAAGEGEGEKHNLADKIKDKLPFGKKE